MENAVKKTVLVVEDEPAILMLLVDYLTGEGYQVLQADSADTAFLILAGRPRLDLLISDYRLPGGVSGVKIAEPALKLRPDLQVIFISGYATEIFETGSDVLDKATVLGKPFSMETLKRTMESLLG